MVKNLDDSSCNFITNKNMNNKQKLIKKELEDLKLDLKMTYPNVDFAEDVILNVEVSSEIREEYKKLYVDASK